MGSEKTGHVACCRVVWSMCELAYTVAATHDIFVETVSCCDDQTWSCCIYLCELIHLTVWEAKTGSCRMLSCRVVSCLCGNWLFKG